jgi:hypothetical protein
MSYVKIILRAEKHEKNINRVYEVYLSKGLLASWIVMTAFGRFGAGSQQKVYSFSALEEAKEFITKILKKRFTAEKRVGCNYKLIKRSSSIDFDELVFE